MAHEDFNDGVKPKDDDAVDFEEMDAEEAEDSDVDDDESDDESEEEEESESQQGPRRVYLPNYETDKNVKLECDESAYICYQSVKTGSPCLSFDIIPDSLGDDRADNFPLSMTVVGGTQVARAHANHLMVLRMSNMHRNKAPKERTEDSESESESEDEDGDKSVLETATIKHSGCVNRVKVTTLNNEVYAASWSELGKVFLWNLSRPISAVNNGRVMAAYIQNKENVDPVFTFAGHLTEGYAVEWSPLMPGTLATGDCRSNIHIWKTLEGGSWHVDQRPYTGHTDSVEDIQFSPNENNVLASCSIDASIRIWDIRAAPNKACMLTKEKAHDTDVNVISWNKSDPFILSGGDDGKLRVWDLRSFPGSDPICTFKHHTAPITSVEWHPTDHSVFAASSADDQLTQWDLGIERDEDQSGEGASAELLALPPQLLFMHLGQKEIKEVHWHKQMPGVLVSTGQTGLDIIRTLSV